MPSINDGLPKIVLITVPIPAVILLLVLTLYHLTPLLTLVPDIHLTPLLQRLSTIIPHPKRNLPREFFNLPPRPGTPTASLLAEIGVLGIRGKVILLLCGYASISLAFGWAFLAGETGWWAASVASTAIPSIIGTLALFSICSSDSSKRDLTDRLLCGGGINHSNVFSRILPLGAVVPVFVTVIAAAVPTIAPFFILACTSLMVATTTVGSVKGLLNKGKREQPGQIRLPTPEHEAPPVEQVVVNDESWLTEKRMYSSQTCLFSCPADVSADQSSVAISSFSYSPAPTVKTPAAKIKPRSTTPNGSRTSWLSSPTNTPNTLPSWEFSPGGVASPPNAMTRSRPSSPLPNGLPPPIQPTPARNGPAGRQSKASKSTVATTAGDRTMISNTNTTFTSPGGSIIAGYDPDPFVPPPPRGFASLTSYPISPEQMGGSGVSLAARTARSAGTISFIPEECQSDGRSSTWTLETYHTASYPETPARDTGRVRDSTASDRRAPPPPPMPYPMPLPPTPTLSRSNTAVDSAYYGKESTEFLIGERDWVEVDPDVDGLDGWSRQGRGVGLVALFALLCSYVSILLSFSGSVLTSGFDRSPFRYWAQLDHPDSLSRVLVYSCPSSGFGIIPSPISPNSHHPAAGEEVFDQIYLYTPLAGAHCALRAVSPSVPLAKTHSAKREKDCAP